MLDTSGTGGGNIIPITGDTIKQAQESLKTGVIGRRTTVTYHYAKKTVVEEDSFTFRLWELVFAALVGTGAYGIYKWEGSSGDLKWWEALSPITLLGRLK